MAKGFVIFRDPVDRKLRAWKGTFSQAGQISFSTEPHFFIQPWDPQKPPEILTVEEITSSIEEIRLWMGEVHPGNDDFEKDTTHPDFEQYIRFVQTAIAQGDFEKVVASRSVALNTMGADLESAFFLACDAYPEAFVYLLFHSVQGYWFGASPERFVRANGDWVETTALAGTLSQSGQVWTEKEEQEQSVTEKYFRELMTSYSAEDIHISERTELHQGMISHLASTIRFRMDRTALADFMRQLHPTPAVGGYPKKEALLFIRRFEKVNRQLYSGWLGWMENGVLNSWVNLRCARIFESHIRLFAGCGINLKSDPASEWRETAAKMQVIGRFFRE